MENVIFDGKWTHFSEWKQSSHNLYSFDDKTMNIHLRTAHYGDYIYAFIDPVNDLTLKQKEDHAMICLDGNNEKNQNSDKNDFCFLVILGDKEGVTLRGNSNELDS